VIGETIDGEYRVLERIGEGGFGVVYRCEEVTLKRVVAVKLLRTNDASERDLEGFLTEARILASVNHPNVVQIYRLGNHAGKPYIVTEYLAGRTVREMLARARPATPVGLEYMRQAAGGLEAIHACGIVHRDLTPNNIMVTQAGVVKILDFGLARAFDRPLGATGAVTVPGTAPVAGTAPYMAPEQAQGGKPSTASDIFSFGIILYEMATGQHPFWAEHPVTMLYNMVHREPRPIREVLPACHPALAELVTQCLQKLPAARPATMQLVTQALGDTLTGEDGERTGAAEAAIPRRHPVVWECNPYLNRVMLKHREDFFGRRQETKRIYARLGAHPPGSVSVVGERKIGKSSLLNHIYAPENRAHYVEHPERLIILFIDLQEQHGMSIESFVRMVLGMAHYELQGRLTISDCPPTLDGMKELVQRIDRAGFRLAVLLDEFEAITTSPNFPLEFFSFLRFLANHYNVAYVTSSAKDLQLFCHAKEIADSPFFNIFSTLNLTTLAHDEAVDVIVTPSQKAGRPLAGRTAEILEMGGRFPFFLQMACCHAFEYLQEHPLSGDLDVDEVRERFLDEARPHFRYIWDSFSAHERRVVDQIARRKNPPASLRSVVAELTRKGYVTAEKDGLPRLFSSSFHAFVKSEAGRGGPGSWISRLLAGGGSETASR